MDIESVLDAVITQHDWVNEKFGNIRPIVIREFHLDAYRDRQQVRNKMREVARLIESYRYGKANNQEFETFDIYQAWKDAKEMGGHFVYQKWLSDEAAAERLHKSTERQLTALQHSQLQDLIIDYPKTKAYSKYTLYLSFAAVVISLIALFLKK